MCSGWTFLLYLSAGLVNERNYRESEQHYVVLVADATLYGNGP
jgi:hypothetical protein